MLFDFKQHKQIPVAVMLVVTVRVTGTDKAAFTGAVEIPELQKIRQHKQIPVGVTLLIRVGVIETGTDTGTVDNTSITKNQTTQTNTCGCYTTDPCR